MNVLQAKAAEVLLGPEIGVKRLVSALGGADPPGASHVVRGRRGDIVLALALAAPDRMDQVIQSRRKFFP